MSKNEMLVIDNSRPSAFFLPSATSSVPEEKNGLCLLPGENEVSPGYWKLVKENPGVKIALRAAILKNNGPGKAKPIVQNWNELTVAKAGLIIDQLEDIEELHTIKKNAKKVGVRKLCDLRISEILDANEQ